MKCISMGENMQVRNSAHGSIIPVRERNDTSDLWYIIPYHLQTNNTRNISMVLYVLSKKTHTPMKSE